VDRLIREQRNDMESGTQEEIDECRDIMSHTSLTPEMLENFARRAVRGNPVGGENTRVADWEARRAQRWVNSQIGRQGYNERFSQFTKWNNLHICNREDCKTQHREWRLNPDWWDSDFVAERRIHDAYKAISRRVKKLAGSSMQPHLRFETDLVWDLSGGRRGKWKKQYAAEQANETKLTELRELFRMVVHLRALASIIHYGSYLEDDRIDSQWKTCPDDRTQNHRKPMETAVNWAFYAQAPEVRVQSVRPMPELPPGSLQGWGRLP
jgi:hypothetical protein